MTTVNHLQQNNEISIDFEVYLLEKIDVSITSLFSSQQSPISFSPIRRLEELEETFYCRREAEHTTGPPTERHFCH